MSDILDIINVLEFLKSLPKEVGMTRYKHVESTSLDGEHVVALHMERKINIKWHPGKFIFRVDDQSVLRIMLGIGIPYPLERLDELKLLVEAHTREKIPLGQVVVEQDGPRIVLFTHYALRVYNDWFTSDFRPACQNLLINTMEFMYWDLGKTTLVLGKP